MPKLAELKKDIQKELQTKLIGQEIHTFPELPSTNTWALEQGKANAVDGCVVICDHQSAGKGRLGREWYSPNGGNLYMSILLYPDLAANEIYRLTLLAGAACCEALKNITGKKIHLKWPNDLHYEGRKLGGILCEAGLQQGQAPTAVIGIGINLDLDPETMPPELQGLATSLKEITGQEWQRSRIAAAILNHLENWYLRPKEEAWREVIEYCDEQNILTNRKVTVKSAGETVTGTATGLNPAGHLILTLESGEQRTFSEGDASLAD